MQLKFCRGVWCAYERTVKDGKSYPVRTSLRTTDRDEAERRLRDLKSQVTKPVTLVEDIFPKYLADKEGTGGYAVSKDNWKRLGPFFGHYHPDQIDKELSRAYVTKRRAEGVGDNTIHRELGILRAALNWADKHSPAVVELPRKPPPKERYLTRKEYKALLDGAGLPHVRLFIILALSTAARASALLELTWSQVDFDRGIIKLAKPSEHRRKGRATVPMTVAARKALTEARNAAVSDYVIEYAGGQVTHIRKAIDRARQRAGLEDVSAHVLRHTAAVWMAESGVPMAEISQYLGHSDSKITERVYARFSPEYLRHAAAALEFDDALE